MSSRCIDIGLILLPSVRSHAYCSIFKQLNVCPKEVILLEGKAPRLEELRAEDSKYHYSDRFFNLKPPEEPGGFDVFDFLEQGGTKVVKVTTNDVNSDEVLEAIKSLSSPYFIFSGGGILRPDILKERKIIHVHPGVVPAYRGSTCFYYSVLEENNVGATAIIMDENIDTGDQIMSASFAVNYFVNDDQPLFVDYVLDPFIRAYILKKVLERYMDSDSIPVHKQIESSKPAYYIMHPYLRHLAIKKINNGFNRNAASGIFEI